MAKKRQGVNRRARGVPRKTGELPIEPVTSPHSESPSAHHPREITELRAALDYLREGDVFIVHSLDRLSQAMEDLRGAVLGLTGRSLVVDMIKELLNAAGPEQPASKQLLNAIHAISALQREVLHTRQRSGPGSRSLRKGRKPALSEERAAELRRRAVAGEKKSRLAQEFGISRDTLYRYLEAL